MEAFPYGKAPFWLLVIAVVSSLLRVATTGSTEKRPDLVLVTFSSPHYESYEEAIPEFERRKGVHVQLQFAHWKSLQTRFQNALLAGTEVPDMVEVLEGSLGFFTRGPVEDIGLLDLTDRVRAAGLMQRLVASRFSLWSTGGRIYALPHDVHPVMLAYRRDIVEKLGIDVRELDTWDKFVEVGWRITRDEDGDGIIDRYMIDLPYDGQWGITTLLLQQGGQLFDPTGKVAFNNDHTAEMMLWYLRQTYGPQKIAYDAGWGQPVIQAMTDGLVLFYVTPDWRSRVFEMDGPNLKGKMALMPLPAWEKGGRRTAVWGGTGLLFTKQTKHPDLAWDLAQFLYFDPKAIGKRFEATNIVPVLKEGWNQPELHAPNPYWSNQPIGRMYAELAPSTPPRYISPFVNIAEKKLYEAYSRCIEHYKRYGERGLVEKIHEELAEAEQYVNVRVARGEALEKAE